MIKNIKLSFCSPYQQEQIDDCQKINFIFGSNGSGKTTISSFLAGDTPDRFAASSVEWDSEQHESIYVYNRSFRHNNFQQTIPGIFTLGSATIEEINALEQLKTELSLRSEELRKKSETYRIQIQTTIPSIEEKFKEDAWTQIFKVNAEQFQKAFEGLRASKDKFVTQLKKRINGIPDHLGKVCERSDLISRANALYFGKPERCTPLILEIKQLVDEIEEIRNDKIWNTVIVGNKDVDLAALINELGNSPWVDQGRKYLRTGSKVCPFCQQETITEAFKNKIEAFFDKGYKQQVERMKMLLVSYRELTTRIIAAMREAITNEKAVSIGKLETDVFVSRVSLLQATYSEHEKIMEEKIKEPGRIVSIPDALMAVRDIQQQIIDANSRIDSHNKLVEEHNIEEERLTDDIWATIIHESHILIATYQMDIGRANKAAIGIKNARDSVQREVERLKTIIIEKGKSVTSVQPTIDEINRSLKAYGFTSFSIQPAEGKENYYCIMREDGTLATGTLSEGEETFLSFLYFMQWAKGSQDPEHVSDKKILVLDDPISSLDSTVLYIVGAMVKDLSRRIKDGVGDVNQLFVLTHNVFFHKEASFDPRQSMGNNINFWVIRKDNDISVITNYKQKNPISTSYELLWAELRDNEHISQISIQNAMRRIIENYFDMLGNGKDDTLLTIFETAEEKMIARSLLYWINDGSHSIPDDLHIDSYTDAIPKYRAVFKEIFRASGHLAHYNMMMRIRDKT